MVFDSFTQLVTMDGHGPYVWSTYAIGIGVMSFLILAPLMRQRRLLRAIRMQREELLSSE